MKNVKNLLFQSLFYWITYSYEIYKEAGLSDLDSFNPYFTGLPILIEIEATALSHVVEGFNSYFTGLPILILPRIGH